MTSFLYLYFNSVDLTSLTGVLIDHINKDNLPARLVQTADLSRGDGRAYVRSKFDAKDIIIVGRIIATDKATFEQNRSTLVQNLIAENASLDLNIGLSILRYYATVSECIFSDTSGGFSTFTIKFVCRDPVGIDINLATGLATTAITAATSTQNLSSIGGNYKTKPVINVYINSGTDMTTKSITITNPANGKAVVVTRTWAAGERLVIDGRDTTVKVNGVSVAYTGDIPTWDVGSGTIQYDDDFTARNISLTMQYNKRYL